MRNDRSLLAPASNGSAHPHRRGPSPWSIWFASASGPGGEIGRDMPARILRRLPKPLARLAKHAQHGGRGFRQPLGALWLAAADDDAEVAPDDLGHVEFV